MIRTVRGLLLHEHGISSIEFALVLPVFLMMLVGGMHLSMLGFTAAGLHFAVEDGVRCGAVQTTRCPTQTSAETRASGKFQNITGAAAAFVATPTASCGYQMTGSATYTLRTGMGQMTVPLSATACYPL